MITMAKLNLVNQRKIGIKDCELEKLLIKLKYRESIGADMNSPQFNIVVLKCALNELTDFDQRRLGALILPTQDEVVALAKKLSILNGDAAELSKGKILSLLYDELRRWTLDCSFQIGPVLIVEEPFTGSS
ncbi:uncharacterized protein A4U43_C06F6930 [Asparagus officinalis]|uniref:Uncharacterized protein n=1 Tax=Asparagus officinalis TaxID=4686 RepID=A0A5P1EP77_ASPOF|nr:uncharacterized protein A4U43_C06F6930 [Asparagus officinalis]